MNEPDLTEIAALIDRSSLGTGEAVVRRAATPPETVRQVVCDATATRPEPAVRHDPPEPPPAGHLTAGQRTSRGDGQAGTPGTKGPSVTASLPAGPAGAARDTETPGRRPSTEAVAPAAAASPSPATHPTGNPGGSVAGGHSGAAGTRAGQPGPVAGAGHSAIATSGAMAAMAGAFAAGAETLTAWAAFVTAVAGSATEDTATTDAISSSRA